MNSKARLIYQLEFLAVAAILVAFVMLDAWPKITEIYSLMQSIERVQKTAETMPAEEKERIRLKLADEYERMEEGFIAVRKMVETVDPKLAKESDTPKITLKLEEMATTADLSLLSVKPVTSEAAGGFKIVAIALELECDYHQLVNFLAQWDSAPFFMAVQEMSVRQPTGLSSKLDVHLVVNVLFRS